MQQPLRGQCKYTLPHQSILGCCATRRLAPRQHIPLEQASMLKLPLKSFCNFLIQILWISRMCKRILKWHHSFLSGLLLRPLSPLYLARHPWLSLCLVSQNIVQSPAAFFGLCLGLLHPLGWAYLKDAEVVSIPCGWDHWYLKNEHPFWNWIQTVISCAFDVSRMRKYIERKRYSQA